MRSARPLLVLVALLWLAAPLAAQRRAARPNPKLTQYKQEVVKDIDARADFTAQMVDQIFSYGELGFQEFETSQYLIKVLRDNGFTVQEHYAGIPTAVVATWGSGKPVISLSTVLRSNPDVVEANAPGMILPSVDFDRLTIEGDLTYEDTLNEPYPGNSYNSVEWPGVHGVA